MYLCVAGNIAAGKSTLVKLLSERLGFHPFLERTSDNPFLEDFYSHRSRWSFHTQISFLTKRYQSHLEAQNTERPTVMDRSIFEDAEVFSRTAFLLGWLERREYETYLELYRCLTQKIKQPSLVIYLRCRVETLLYRVEKRGRHFEKNIDGEYLSTLTACYEEWIQKSETKALVIDTECDDYSVIGNSREKIMKKIADALDQTKSDSFMHQQGLLLSKSKSEGEWTNF